jgi:hypothetical protein
MGNRLKRKIVRRCTRRRRRISERLPSIPVRSIAKKKGHPKALRNCAASECPSIAVPGLRRLLPAKALAAFGDGDGFVDVMMRFVKMLHNTRL